MNQQSKGELNQQGALNILISAVEAACMKGLFTLKDAKLVAEAVEVFQTPATPEVVPETSDVSKSDTNGNKKK
jgi:hypothetical protein